MQLRFQASAKAETASTRGDTNNDDWEHDATAHVVEREAGRAFGGAAGLPHARAALRSCRVRGDPLLSHAARACDLPPAGAPRAAAPFGEGARLARASLRDRGSRGRLQERGARERVPGVLHPPADLA